ncbi:MAG: class I SAM-dependent methyltransferase [Candidatus ainarchaeum sp.]|nr:class I SAM-dependent methyltransferase [Candidatus ainarchaeum sp.]
MHKKNPISMLFLKARHRKTAGLLDGVVPKSVLDVGCDDGRFLRMLAEAYPKATLYGCDSDPEAAREARDACPSAAIVQGDFMKLDFKPVDVVVMLEVLEHASEPVPMLKKAAALVGKKGRVLVSIPRPELLRWRLVWSLWSNTFGRRWHGQHRHLTEAELTEAAARCGLKVEKRQRFFLGCISMTLFRQM